MKVLLFETNVMKPEQKPQVAEAWQSFKGILNWDIDFKDEYFTLRVLGSGVMPEQINVHYMQQVLNAKRFETEQDF